VKLLFMAAGFEIGCKQPVCTLMLLISQLYIDAVDLSATTINATRVTKVSMSHKVQHYMGSISADTAGAIIVMKLLSSLQRTTVLTACLLQENPELHFIQTLSPKS